MIRTGVVHLLELGTGFFLSKALIAATGEAVPKGVA